MPADMDKHIVRRQYLAHNGEDLLSQVQKVICLVTPHVFISAGYHPSGEVLMVNSSRYDVQAWAPKFIEYEFLNDPLFAAPEMVQAVFVASSKNMLVPDELFEDKEEASHWLKKIYHCEEDDALFAEHFSSNKLHCCFAFEASIVAVLSQYLSEIRIKPLTMVHFKDKVADALQCTIADTYAKATLHFNNKLVWHQTFEYETAEDILYQLSAACQVHEIDIQDFLLSFTTTSIEDQPILKKLKHYFPKYKATKSGIADIIAPDWAATVFLFQQLYGCAS